MQSFEEFQEKLNNEKDVEFSYTKEELNNILTNYKSQINSRSSNVIEDYADSYSLIDVIIEIEKFNNLNNKNDFGKVSEINDSIIKIMSNNSITLPNEIKTTVDEISKHFRYLLGQKTLEIKTADEKIRLEKEIKEREEQERIRKEQEENNKIQQERLNEIRNKIPIINEKLNYIKSNVEVYESRRVDLLRERTYFYNKKSNITQEDIIRLDDYIKTLDELSQKVNNLNSQKNTVNKVEPPKEDNKEKIEELKEKIKEYDIQINKLFANMQPYMQIPKVNRELSKVAKKNEEISNMSIIDSLSDYKRIIEVKGELISFLNKANDFIKTRVEQHSKNWQPVVEQPQEQKLPDNFWGEFDKPIERPQEKLPDDFWKEFDEPIQGGAPERKFNPDGTYTIEYISHLANTPVGFNRTIYDQLMQSNEAIRKSQNQQVGIDQEAPSSGGMHI